jgi:26S proteasome regulatory subunit (ATPase 3-interacting protein)
VVASLGEGEMDPSEVVIKYLRDQNRPYSTNDIFSNLREEIKKPSVQKALDHLTEQGRITEKVYGKQKVYVVKQEHLNAKDLGQELHDLDSKLNALSHKLASAEQELKSSENLFHELQCSPTTSEAQEEQKVLENKVQTLKEKLESISKSTVKIPEDDKERIQTDHENSIKEWKKRKRLCMDIIDTILESYPDSKRSLLNEMGIETDEDVGVPLIL